VTYLEGETIDDLKEIIAKFNVPVNYSTDKSRVEALVMRQFEKYKLERSTACVGTRCVWTQTHSFTQEKNFTSRSFLSALHGQCRFYSSIAFHPHPDMEPVQLDVNNEMKILAGDAIPIHVERWLSAGPEQCSAQKEERIVGLTTNTKENPLKSSETEEKKKPEPKKKCDCKACRLSSFNTIPTPKGFLREAPKRGTTIHIHTSRYGKPHVVTGSFFDPQEIGYVSGYKHIGVYSVFANDLMVHGDSGAMVCNDQDHCFGILIGSTENHKVFVTPIKEIEAYYGCKMSLVS